jgi:hypothetical protein
MLSMNVSVLRILLIGEIEEITGYEGYTYWRIDQTDRENKTQEEIERGCR